MFYVKVHNPGPARMFEMFDKEQKIVDRGWNDLFPGAKKTLIKRAKSARRREERDSINSILKDPGSVLMDSVIDDIDWYDDITSTQSVNNDDATTSWMKSMFDMDDDDSFMADIFGKRSDDDYFDDDWMNMYGGCDCRWCRGYEED